MRRRDFLKFGSAGLAVTTFGGLTRYPILKIGEALAQSSSSPWSFGVMGDTQWTTTNYVDPAGTNPYSCAASIIDQVNAQFINLGVQFVIQVGDLSDEGLDLGMATRASHCTALYNAGIGFFPLRGNHETYGAEYGSNTFNYFSIPALQSQFPQTQGLSLFTPSLYTSTVSPVAVSGAPWNAYNFSSPLVDNNGIPIVDLAGITYSFDWGNSGSNVRFLLLDCWPTPASNWVQPPPAYSSSNPGYAANADGYGYGYTVQQQQPWISQQLDIATRGTTHAFVFAHQPLMAEDHQDTMFSGYTNANPSWQNAFYSSLMSNGVGYFISGHDHIHQRSIIQSPDGLSNVQELICQSCSSKFYTPASLTSSGWYGQKYRETSMSQEMYTVGFYVFTINGPTVTVDFYSDTHGNWLSSGSYPGNGYAANITPTFTFAKKETWGYTTGQNGQATFTLTQGENPGWSASFGSTTAWVNKTTITAQDYTGRDLTKDAYAWWIPQASISIVTPGLTIISDGLSLLGTSAGAVKDTVDSTTTNPNDPVAVLMTYPSSVSLSLSDVNAGRMISVNTIDDSGNSQNAVNSNFGGRARFVYGSWNAAYPVGTYGVDATNNIAWAVVNHDSDFVVVKNF